MFRLVFRAEMCRTKRLIKYTSDNLMARVVICGKGTTVMDLDQISQSLSLMNTCGYRISCSKLVLLVKIWPLKAYGYVGWCRCFTHHYVF